MLRRHAGVAQVEARDPGEVAAALAELADPPPDVLVLGLRPYWGPRHGAFFFSALRARPAHALRTVPSLFWGRAGALATPANGYYSQKADEVLLEVDGPITLDGEIYQVSRERGAVRVSTGGWPSFLQI